MKIELEKPLLTECCDGELRALSLRIDIIKHKAFILCGECPVCWNYIEKPVQKLNHDYCARLRNQILIETEWRLLYGDGTTPSKGVIPFNQ